MNNWIKAIFTRDDYRCFGCAKKSGEVGKRVNLQAHHIYYFSKYPRLRFILENGITLCRECHVNRHRLESGKLVAIA